MPYSCQNINDAYLKVLNQLTMCNLLSSTPKDEAGDTGSKNKDAMGSSSGSVGATSTALKGPVPVQTPAPIVTPIYPEIPFRTMERIKISFYPISSAADSFEKGADLVALGEKIMEVHNDVSKDCYETHHKHLVPPTFISDKKFV